MVSHEDLAPVASRSDHDAVPVQGLAHAAPQAYWPRPNKVVPRSWRYRSKSGPEAGVVSRGGTMPRWA
jgi:hypothetical protein